MSDRQYNLNFEKLCATLQLGELVGTLIVLTGGLLHRMYAVETTQGKYAIKALNPQVMIRPKAMQNICNSERIANVAANHVPALPAKQFNGTAVQQIDNQCYLVFDWVEGRSLKANEMNKVHCEIIGAILADIHMTDFTKLGLSKEESADAQLINWTSYLEQGQINHAIWAPLLRETLDRLYDWNAKANDAVKQLESNMVISHLDLDSKNVMWNEGNPILIDWEASGHIHPMQSLTETAVYWSEDETGALDKERFMAFVRGYKKRYGAIQANWNQVLETGFAGMLGWLEYNLKRSLWIECTDKHEQQMGTDQVTATINALIHYADSASEIEQWLVEESK